MNISIWSSSDVEPMAEKFTSTLESKLAFNIITDYGPKDSLISTDKLYEECLSEGMFGNRFIKDLAV